MTFQNCGALGQALGFPEAEVERVGRAGWRVQENWMSAEHFQGHNKGHSLVKWNDGVVSRMELRGDEIKDFWGDFYIWQRI